LLKNIHHRGREYELDIKSEYLAKIQESYLDYIRKQPNLRVVIIDTNKLDFVHRRKDYQTMIEIISKEYPVGVHTIVP
jgi:deoxyadenosine/deoxycytidine kinase